MANIFEKIYEYLKEKGKGSLSSNSGSSGPYTSSAGSSGQNRNTSTYSGVTRQTNKAYNQPFTSSNRNYSNVNTNVAKRKSYSQPFISNSGNSSYQNNTPKATLSLKQINDRASDVRNNVVKGAAALSSLIGTANKTRREMGMSSPIQGVAEKTTPIIQGAQEKTTGFLQNVQQEQLDDRFAELTSISGITDRIKTDQSYAEKLMDPNGSLIDYTQQIDEIKQQMANPVTRSEELKAQLDELEGIQSDQNRLLYTSYYNQLIEKGATQDELNQFKNYVIAEDYNGVERLLATVGGSLENYAGSMAKYYESLYAATSNLLGVDYNPNDPNSIGNYVIENSEQLLNNAKQGASGVERTIQEIYTSEANYLYSVALSMLTNGASFSDMSSNETVSKTVSDKALLYSDMSVFGSTIKRRMDEGYDFWTSFDSAGFAALLADTTERIGGETFFEIFSKQSGQEMAKNLITYTLKHLGKSFGSEAIEEGTEALAEPLLDSIILNGRNMSLKEYVNNLDANDIGYQMLIGGLGGLFGGVSGITGLTISTNRDLNQMKSMRSTIQELHDSDSFDANDKAYLRSMIRDVNEMITKYRTANPYADAFLSKSDLDVIETSIQENEETMLGFAQVDLANKLEPIVALKEQMLQRTDEFYAQGREKLAAENIDMDIVDYENLSSEAKINASIAAKYAQSLNRAVSFANLVDADGEIVDGVYMNGRTVINPNAKQGALSTLLHEYTHGMEASKYYFKLRDSVKEYMGENYDSAIEVIKEKYSTIQNLSDTEAEKELVAITSQGLLENMQFVDRLVKYNNSLATRIYEDIKHLAGFSDEVGNIEYNFMRAFNNAKDGTSSDEVQLSLSSKVFNKDGSFRSFLDQITDKSFPSGSSYGVAENTNELLNGKLNDNQLWMRQGIVKKAKKSHGVDFDFVKTLPERLKNYSMIARSLTRDNSVVVVTDKTIGGDPVVVSINLDGLEKGIPFNEITSVYPRENYDYFVNELEKNNKIIDKKEKALSEWKSYPEESPDTTMPSSEAEVKNDADTEVENEVLISSEEGSGAKLSLGTWLDTDKKQIISDLTSKLGVSQNKARKWVNDVNGVAKMIADNRMILDYDPNPNYSSMKSNDEYVASMDMSTLCKKREMLQGTIDEIQKRLPNYDIDGTEYTKIRQMMKDRGYEVACGFCYVESRRKELGKVAKGFIEARNYEDLTIRDLTTVDGVAELQKNRPEIYEDFVKFNNKRGSGKVNLVQSRTEYRGEIVDPSKLTKGQIEKINRIGGLRLQSYSDFETPHLIDMMQITIDMARRGLTSQAYTKVPAFADAFGKTGIKINESLVCKGVDSKGKLIFDDVEGMPHDEAFRIRRKHPDTVGTILVGKDDATIKAAMADPRIDFIIPFHRSGWGKAEYAALGIDGYEDYTSQQKEYWVTPKQIIQENGKTRTENAPVDQFYPIDYWDYSKTGKENAETYLKLCAEDGRIPKFSNFLVDNGDGSWSLQPDGSTDGYWKMLIDFKMYDNNGVGAPQRTVQPIFDNKVNKKILNSYEGDHRKNRFAADVVNEFVNDVKGNTQLSKGLSLDDLNAEARKDLRDTFQDKTRRINLKQEIQDVINEIRTTGQIEPETYDALREKVVESSYSKVPNDAYEIAQGIREIMGGNFLRKEGWDKTLAEINEKYHIYDENTSIASNSYTDAKNYIRDYIASLGDRYVYMNPVDLGDLSQDEFDSIVNRKLNETIEYLRDSIENETLDEYGTTADVESILDPEQSRMIDDLIMEDATGDSRRVAQTLNNIKYDMETGEIIEDLYKLGNDALEALINEDPDGTIQKMAEEAATGNYTPEALDLMEKEVLKGLTIENAKKQTPEVLKNVEKKKPLRSTKEILYQVRQKIFDKGIAIRDMKDRKLSVSYDYLLSAENMANKAILDGIYDQNGKKMTDSLISISKLIPADEKNDFDYYMYHAHNVDAAKIGKDVFFGFPSIKSQEIVNQYEMLHPEWKAIAQKYYDYNDVLLQRQVDSGVISQDTANRWKEMYPHYVPTKRAMETVDDGSVIETADPKVTSSNKGTLYERTGGSSPIQPLDYAMAEHTKQIYKSSLFNKFAKEYIRASNSPTNLFNEDRSFDENIIEGKEEAVQAADEYTPATLIYYDQGDRQIVELPQNIYDALGPTETPFDLPSNIPFVSWATKLRTNMITGANPVFWLTNGFKDFQDIGFNSKYAKDTYFNLPRAYKQLITNGDLARIYKANGGEYQTYSSEAGINQNDHGKFYNATIGNFVKFNELVEMAPRLAEFMSSLDHGDSIEAAMYNAAEVTTNFKRGGDYAKWLNRNGFNFLNASIQGFDKQIRNIEDAYDSRGWKGIVSYMTKATLLSGIPLVVLNGLLHKDDEDYDQLSDYIKDNYYILWKYDDGKFVRIPKGRIANAYQGIMTALYENGVELAGDDSATKKAKKIWENTLDSLLNVWEQVGINDMGGNNILSPVIQMVKNEAWYGDPIVSTYMQKKDPADQYDESTDLMSIWLGEKLNYSPKKINYLIDQYSGGAGDAILPMLTQKAETRLDDGTIKGKVSSAVLSPLVDKFTADSVFKNQDVTDFFTLDEELTAMAQKEHASDESILASKYINSIQKQMNELYAERRSIYKDDSLTDAQKYDKAREVQRKIDDLARLGLDTYDQIDMGSYYGNVNGISYYKNGNDEWTKTDQEKEGELDALGLNADQKSDYYYTKNAIANIRKDIKADTPEGETPDYKAATINAIRNSGLNAKSQNYLYDSYYSGALTERINGMDLSDEEKLALKFANANATSVKDKNGKTVTNSKALSVADAYADAGLLDDVYEYIKKNGLKPSDMGLTKTVYGYSYEKLAAAYKKVFGQEFGTGETVDLGNTSYNTSGGSSRRSSGSSSETMSKKEQQQVTKLKKALINALKKINANSTISGKKVDYSNILRGVTNMDDAKNQVEKIMANINKM